MAKSGWKHTITMSIDNLIENTHEYDFYQAVYALERQLANGKDQQYQVGHDSLPKNELLRFKSDQHLGFPGTSVSKVEEREGNGKAFSFIDMHVSFMGLTGTSGVLPQHYTELLLQRLRYKDSGMRDFFDLFNHRLISLYYRAWKKYRFATNISAADSQKADPFTTVLNELTGSYEGIGKYYAGIYNRKIRSSAGLTLILNEFTGGKVEIEQFQGQWQNLAENEQTQLAKRTNPEGQFACLGVDTCLGSRVWDINSAIKINIHPNKNHQLKDYLKGGKLHQVIKSLITSYLGNKTKYSISLIGMLQNLPSTQLSNHSLSLGKGCKLMHLHDTESIPQEISIQI